MTQVIINGIEYVQKENQAEELFNKGVDAAMIEVLEKKRIYESIHRPHKQLPMLELFFDEIIVKIKKLKSKQHDTE